MAPSIGEVLPGAGWAVLPDGRLVVAGGLDGEGYPVATVAIYDPLSAAWQQAGRMAAARAGHTLTAFSDGRLLITGGRTSTGLTASTEI